MAQNVIVPVIDLTSAAEGSTVPQMLQTAINFGGANAFSASNSTAVIANTAGFWRINGISQILSVSSQGISNKLNMSDGLSTKTILGHEVGANVTLATAIEVDLIVFLDSGDSISAVSNDGKAKFVGSARQIADINGTLINPVGFNPQ